MLYVDENDPPHGTIGDRHVTTTHAESGRMKTTVDASARWCASCHEWKVPKSMVSMVMSAVCCPTCKTEW